VPLERRLRLIGVRVGKLEKAGSAAQRPAVHEARAAYDVRGAAAAGPATLDLF
jgi:hypothetical protein